MVEPFVSMSKEEAEIFMKGNNHPIRERVAELVVGRSVLDLGCGRGIKIKELYPSYAYVGIDCSKELINLAKKDNPQHSFYSVEILDFLSRVKDKSSPVSIMISVLEHVPSLEIAQKIYAEARRVSQELFVGWHHPPHYRKTKHLKVRAELNELMWQNCYAKGSFGGNPEIEKIKFAELWQLRD